MVRFTCVFVFFFMALVQPSLAGKRALVIGNDQYDELPDLQKAVADASAYADVLKGHGYRVKVGEDLSTTAMQRMIGEFIDTIEPGDEVAFVYAGHGWSDGSANFIIGTDTEKQTSPSTLRRAAIPIENGNNGVIDDMRGQGARIVLSVLDACRNNPFQSKNGRSGSVGLSRGLVLLTPVSGTFSVFSAGAGEEALDRLGEDDSHPNSVFSRVFLEKLSEGGSLQDIILDTAPRVAELADSVGHTQRPSYYDGIGERYCLTDNCAKQAPTFTAALAPSRTAPVNLPVAPVKLEPVEIEPFVIASPVPTPNPGIAPVFRAEPSVIVQDSSAVPPAQNSVAIIAETDPYSLPDLPEPVILQPAQNPAPVRTGAPVQFIVRSASPIRTPNQLDRESICTVANTPQQPTITHFFVSQNLSHYNRKFRNLKRAVQALERSRCAGIAVPPRLVSRVISNVRDPSRYIVLPQIIQ